MLIVFLRGVILYVLVIFSIRLMGKRQLGELQPSELVITILISNIATLPIEDINIPMTTGVIPILTLVCLDVLVSAMALRSRKLRRLISGSPKIIISNGEIDQFQLKKLRYTVDDLMESLRSQGVFDISEVQFAVVETTGKISVYQKPDSRPATQKDLKLHNKPQDPPRVVIDDGDIIFGKDGSVVSRAEAILRGKELSPQEVFLMTCDDSGNVTIVKKEAQKPSKG